MIEKSGKEATRDSSELTFCGVCKHFTYFDNNKGHNSPHAFGKCRGESWDGNMGQWAMFQHQCKNFAKANGQSDSSDISPNP